MRDFTRTDGGHDDLRKSGGMINQASQDLTRRSSAAVPVRREAPNWHDAVCGLL